MPSIDQPEFVDIEISVSPDDLNKVDLIENRLYNKLNRLGWKKKFYFHYLLRKSLDARKKKPVFKLRYRVYRDEVSVGSSAIPLWHGKNVKESPEVVVIGAGPAGYFAALELIENGIKPIVLDRGKDVRERRRDLRQIQQFGVVNPDSNYCFGEGGAGTYSDGKLYTRSHKRGKIQSILEALVAHGATSEILYDAHPHIGSNKLPRIISNIRETIQNAGGEVIFGQKVTDFLIDKSAIKGVVVESGRMFPSNHVILATGHSARDIYDLLDEKQVKLEFKAFALGVRVEHPQAFIDESQLNMKPRHPNISAASYKLVCQVEDHGVYSFCMCPGGLIVPAATSPGEIVVNGMSLSKRDSPFANSGVVVEVREEDLSEVSTEKKWDKGILFQQSVEKTLFNYGDGSQLGPAQLVVDFIAGKLTANEELPSCSYIPGIYSAPLHELLPDFIVSKLKKALQEFDKKMRGYAKRKALIVAVESRTSSPVRIPRNDHCESPDLEGLFPCGEGGGYAGGIVSAALDGKNVAKSVASLMSEKQLC